MNTKLIYKIATREQWEAAKSEGVFKGAPIDLQDGFIHFSTAETVRETVALHFAGQSHLLLIAVDEGRLGDALVYEKSRGGALFPHLYGVLEVDTVEWIDELPLGDSGDHGFPARFED